MEIFAYDWGKNSIPREAKATILILRATLKFSFAAMGGKTLQIQPSVEGDNNGNIHNTLLGDPTSMLHHATS